MNSYSLNGQSGHCFRKAICTKLNIGLSDVYKAVKDIKRDGTIVVREGNLLQEYELKLVKKCTKLNI